MRLENTENVTLTFIQISQCDNLGYNLQRSSRLQLDNVVLHQNLWKLHIDWNQIVELTIPHHSFWW